MARNSISFFQSSHLSPFYRFTILLLLTIILISTTVYGTVTTATQCTTTIKWKHEPPSDSSSQGSIQVEIVGGYTGQLKITAQKISSSSPDLTLECSFIGSTLPQDKLNFQIILPLSPDQSAEPEPGQIYGANRSDIMGFHCDDISTPYQNRYPIKFIIADNLCTSIYSFPGISPITLQLDHITRVFIPQQGQSLPDFSQNIIEPQLDYDDGVAFYYLDQRDSTDPAAPPENLAQLLALGPDPRIDFIPASLHATIPGQIYPDNSPEPGKNMMITTYPTYNYIANKDLLCKKSITSASLCDIARYGGTRVINNIIWKDFRYDFTVERTDVTRVTYTLGYMLSNYIFKPSFPKTRIFDYIASGPGATGGLVPTYEYTTNTGSFPIEFNLGEPIQRQENDPDGYITSITCSFPFTTDSLDQFLATDYFQLDIQGQTIPIPDQNQFIMQLELTKINENQPPLLVTYGNPFTSAQWYNIIKGSSVVSPGTFELYQNSFGTITRNDLGVSKHYIQYKLVYTVDENPGNRHLTFNADSDENPERFRGIVDNCILHDMPTDSEAHGTFIPMQTSDSFYSKSFSIDTTDAIDTPPWQKLEIHCDYYRPVDIGPIKTFDGVKPQYGEVPRFAPTVLVKHLSDLYIDGSISETLKTPTQYFPKFIPTPSIVIKSSSALDGPQNLGVSIASWDISSYEMKILPSFDISTLPNPILDLSPDPINRSIQLFSLDEYQTDPGSLSNLKMALKLTEATTGSCGDYSPSPSSVPITSGSNNPLSIFINPNQISTSINDNIRQCQLNAKFSIYSEQESIYGPEYSYEFIIPVWKRSEIQNGSPETNNFIGFTLSNAQNIDNQSVSPTLTYPLSTSPISTNPITLPNIYLHYDTTVTLHICYFEPLTNLSDAASLDVYFRYVSFDPSNLMVTPGLDLEKDKQNLSPKAEIVGALSTMCTKGAKFKIIPNDPLGTPYTENLFYLSTSFKNTGASAYGDDQFSKLFVVGPPPSVPPPLHRIFDLKFNPLFPNVSYQPQMGSKIQVFSTNENGLRIDFKLDSKYRTSTDLSISFQTPIWIDLDLTNSICTYEDRSGLDDSASYTAFHQSQPSVSAMNPDVVTRVVSIPSFFPVVSDESADPEAIKPEFVCNIRFQPNSRIPLNPILPIPVTPITIQYTTGDPIPQIIQTTLKQTTGVFLHTIAAGADTSCNTDPNNPFAQCTYAEIPITITPTAPTIPPLQTTKLPTTTHSLTGVCDVVLTNKNSVDIYTDAKYSQMCSIPIAGTLSHRIMTRNELITSHPTILLDSFPQDKTDFSLCDCKCKGYWYDDVMNQDYKKCSKCMVPQCPEMLTPNSDCTACECITVQCKQYKTYVFSTIYFKPEVLRYIVDSFTGTQASTPTTVNYNTQPLTNSELSTFLHSPSKPIQMLYFNTMTSFSNVLSTSIQDQISLSSDSTQSTLESITITPLVEGSFTVWKVTLSIINHSRQPLSTLAPLYGLPSVENTIGTMFGAFHTQQLGLLDAVTPPQLELDVTSPTLSNTNLKLFTTDVIKTGCLSRANAKSLGSTTPATIDMLHSCPLPNQYTTIPNDSTKTDLLNPLWSSCSSSLSSPSTFIKYESLLDLSAVTTIDIRIREIYPRCIDFTGVDVGLLHVPCAIDKSKLLYSSESSTLLLPTYTQSLLSSFTTSTLDSVVETRMQDMKSIPLPKFPSFPQLTVAPCLDSLSSPSTTNQQRCLVGYYGPDCSLQNKIEPTSMFTSPTDISTQSHSHIQWEYMGDATQELTLVLQSSHTNNGQGYFAWSQLLGTVPAASLYASTQIPTIDNSKLFQYIYNAIETGNTAFTTVYNADTEIIIRGYFTRIADQGIGLDPGQIIQQFTFKLPMLCQDFNVQCHDLISQHCNQNNGRCQCRPGFVNANPNQARSPNYTVETVDTTTVNIDGDDLQCVSICNNGGEWDITTGLCKCLDGTSGNYCEVVEMCAVQRQELCSDIKNGYVGLDSTQQSAAPYQLQSLLSSLFSSTQQSQSSTCSTTCDCFGKWTEPFVSVAGITEQPLLSSKSCGFCPLKPLSRQLYTETTITDLENIIDNYKTDSKLSSHATYDEKYTQTYQPQSIESEPLTQQRCYITGTDQMTYQPGNCSQCLCQRGYGGEYCQLHIAYANITYTPGVNNKYTYDSITEVLLFDKIGEELSLSMTNFDKSQLFIVQHNTDQYWIEVGFYTGLDFFTRNQDLLDQQQSQLQQSQLQQSQLQQSQLQIQSSSFPSSPFTTLSTTIITLFQTLQLNTNTNTPFNSWNLPPTNYNTQLPTNLDNLYTQWGQLQQGLPQAPITNQDSNKFLGDIDIKEPVQDTVCFDQGLLGCSGEPPNTQQQRANGNGLLIGLVVGLVSAAILFIILVIILLWCKSNKRGLWKSKEDQDRDEMSNFVPTTRKGFTGSTDAPSMTVGTVSIKPVTTTTTTTTASGGNGVEMSNTGSAAAPSSVQSVNNHIEVKDKTLPANYKAYQDSKNNIFYVNTETMTTSWAHPTKVVSGGGVSTGVRSGGADAGYGSDW